MCVSVARGWIRIWIPTGNRLITDWSWVRIPAGPPLPLGGFGYRGAAFSNRSATVSLIISDVPSRMVRMRTIR